MGEDNEITAIRLKWHLILQRADIDTADRMWGLCNQIAHWEQCLRWESTSEVLRPIALKGVAEIEEVLKGICDTTP